MASGFKDVEVVGFDLDQTLYPKSPEIDQAIQYYLYQCISERHGVTIEEARALFEDLYQEGNGLSGGEAMRRLGFDDGAELVQQALECADLSDFLVPNTKDIALLERLRVSHSLDIITGSNRSNTLIKLSKLAISESTFGHIITADDYSKSSGEAYEAWLDMYPNTRPDQFLYVGDRFKTDHIEPREFGIKTVIVNVGEVNTDYDCLQIPTLADLGDYFD